MEPMITFHSKKNYGLGSAFSIEVWIKPDPQPEKIDQVTYKPLYLNEMQNSLINGYDLRLVGNTLSFNWNNTVRNKLTIPSK
jgi:hypothetical protein